MDHPYSQLTPEVVLEAVDSHGFISDGRLLALNSYENRVYQVGIEDSTPVIVKFYRPKRWRPEQILEEHQFCLDLAAEEWPVVAPMQDPQGKTLFEYAGFSMALFERRGGRAPELGDLDNLEVLGRALGRLHAIGQQRVFHHRPQIDVAGFGDASQEYLLKEGFIPESLIAAYETLSDDLLKLIRERFDAIAFSSLRLHGDCHPGNILWRDDTPLFVDFDDARTGPAIQDIWMLLSGSRHEQQLQLDAVLEGYELFREFDNRELGLIESLRTLRIMYQAAWIARRWQDPAFPKAFSWFNTETYWARHITDLREQFFHLQEAPLQRL